MRIDNNFIQAFIDRWRLETHTFHIRYGECTINLQDVDVLLGLSIDGVLVLGATSLPWLDIVE